MREILYVQAGNLANYIGTHFWNTQESYFTYSDDDEALVDHDISFREGQTSKGESTYCPRLISFDRRANFGALAKTNNFSEVDHSVNTQLWQGETVEYEQDPIEPHSYQAHLEAEEIGATFLTETVRYWSDFNRVFYIPRTIQMLPDVPDWQITEGDWSLGRETFQRFNEDTELMESSVRLFLEECNSFQGLQLMSDTSIFGSFINSFLMAFYDELSKVPCLSFPLMGDAVPRNVNLENTLHIRKVVNDAVYLRELDHLSILTTPILNPITWSQGSWSMDLKQDGSQYHTSSILSAHIENATVPLRLKGMPEDISNFSKHLNQRGSHRFGQLSGVFPVAAAATPQDFWQRVYNFSVPQEFLTTAMHFGRRDVTRGFSTETLRSYDSWYSQMSTDGLHTTRTHTEAYPLPSSFPEIFQDEEILGNYRKASQTIKSSSHPPSTTMLTSLSTNSATADIVSDYAKFVQACINRRRVGILTGMIESLDDMKELVNDLWTIHDGYSQYSADEPDFDDF